MLAGLARNQICGSLARPSCTSFHASRICDYVTRLFETTSSTLDSASGSLLSSEALSTYAKHARLSQQPLPWLGPAVVFLSRSRCLMQLCPLCNTTRRTILHMQECPPDGFAYAIVSARTLLHNAIASAWTHLHMQLCLPLCKTVLAVN